MTPTTSRRNLARAAAVAVAFAAFTSPLSAQRPRYALQDLNPGDGMPSSAVAINDNGDVAGWYEILRSTRAARTRFGREFEFVPGLEYVTSSASDINAAGDLAGSMVNSMDPATSYAVRYTESGGVTGAGTLGGSSYGVGINRSGQVAGWSYLLWGFDTHAFVWTPGQGILDLGTLSGSGSSFASGINDRGQVSGHSETGDGRWHAFRFTPGWGMQDLGAPPDANTYAAGINASGQVVGRIDRPGGSTHAFRYTDGSGIQDLHTFEDGRSWASDINDAGDVVGFFFPAGATAPRAFLYTDAEGMIDLNTLIDPASGWVLTAALGINNAGQIVGHGKYRDEVSPRAFKLTPRPIDLVPPTIDSLTADPPSLWPANLQMIPVTLIVRVTDNLDPSPTCRILRVTTSEPAESSAINITGDLTLQLRAERAGTGTGRQYDVSVGCSDADGNTALASITIGVPHDKAGGDQ